MININGKIKAMSEELPPKPKKPEDYECCGRHCDPCIMDYYQRAIERWKKKVAAIQLIKTTGDKKWKK